MPKALTKAQLHKKLTTEFNRYIRLRDTWVNDEGERVGICISCGAELPYGSLQAGHFVPANHYIHKYNTYNVNSQCVGCNKWKHGNPFGYWVSLAAKYGPDVPMQLAMSREVPAIYTEEQLTSDIELYKAMQRGCL